MIDNNTADACPSTAVTQARHSACGKAIIVGEHAVVYGAQAVAIPVKSLVTELTMTPSRQHDCRLLLGSLPLSRQHLQTFEGRGVRCV